MGLYCTYAYVYVVAKDRTDFFEVALGRGGDDQNTAQALGDAFEQATNFRSRQLTDTQAQGEATASSLDAQERRNQFGSVHNRNENPGMSVLQDSVLGLRPEGSKSVL